MIFIDCLLMSIDVYCISHISLHFMDCMISRGWLCHIVPSLEVEVVEVGGQKPAKVSDDLASPRGSLWITLTADCRHHHSSIDSTIDSSYLTSYISTHICYIWCDHFNMENLWEFPDFQGQVARADSISSRRCHEWHLVVPVTGNCLELFETFVIPSVILSSFVHPFPSLSSNVLRCFEYMLLKSDELLINHSDMHSTCNDDCVN